MGFRFPATVSVKRELGWFCPFHPLHVSIDGRPAGRVWPKGTGEFLVPSGDHDVTVSLQFMETGPVRVTLRPGARVELVCASNLEPLHPWHAQGCLILLLFSAAHLVLGLFVPQVLNAFERAVFGELVIALGFAWVGMLLSIRKAHRRGAWHPALSLTFAGVGDGQPPARPRRFPPFGGVSEKVARL